ncbi:MAG TPA: enoyl-CoA hydratase-related protein [Myxococcales bacterium]|nr:enoyl-CoA hydratase-related protein [Myxococcales bacterium]
MEPLLSVRRGAVLELRMNNPKRRNGLTVEIADALVAAFEGAARDAAIRAVLLGGVEGHFSSGADLSAALSGEADPSAEGRRRVGQTHLVERFHPALRAIWHCSKPVVAELAGASVGFGMSIALACDVRVMAEDAYLGCGFLKIGLFPDGGALWQLDRLVGLARALELVLDPERRLTAAEAQAWGLAAKVVAPALLAGEALAVAERLAAGPPLVIEEAKRQLRDPSPSFGAALEREVAPVKDCLASDDAAEGLFAFFEKRAPKFKGG